MYLLPIMLFGYFAIQCAKAENKAIQIDQRDGHQVMFYPLGHYATAAEYFHITLEVDATAHFKYMDTVQAQILELAEGANNLANAKIRILKTSQFASKTLHNLRESMNDRLSAMLEESIIVSNQHSIPYEMRQFKNELNAKSNSGRKNMYVTHRPTLLHEHDHVISIEEIQLDLFPRLKYLPMSDIFDEPVIDDAGIFEAGVQRAIFIANEVRNDFNDIVDSAITNRLSTKAIRTETTMKVFNEISAYSKRAGYRLFLQNANDLFKMEASYYQSGKNKFKMVVHVPIVKGSNLLEMLQYIPFPLSQNILNGTSIIPNVGNKDIIAIQTDRDMNHYKLLGESDLIGCTIHENTYLCPDRDQLNTDMGETCLGSLFSHNVEGILHNCKFGLEEDKDYVYAINSNEFLVHMVEPKGIQVQCQDDTYPLQMSVLTHLFLEENCKVNLKYHQLKSGYGTSSKVHLYHTQWKWDAMKLFPNQDERQINDVLLHLIEAGIHVFTAKDIQLWQYDVNNFLLTMGNYGFQFGLFLCVLGITIALIALLKCHCFGCNGCEIMRRKRKHSKNISAGKENKIAIEVPPRINYNYMYRPAAPFSSK